MTVTDHSKATADGAHAHVYNGTTVPDKSRAERLTTFDAEAFGVPELVPRPPRLEVRPLLLDAGPPGLEDLPGVREFGQPQAGWVRRIVVMRHVGDDVKDALGHDDCLP